MPEIGQGQEKRKWRLLQIEPAVACNLHCVMCPWRDLVQEAPHRGVMPRRVWQAIEPYLPEAGMVDLTGAGEPLLQPHLADWVGRAHRAGCRTGLLTNGMLLTPSASARLTDAGIDWVCISLDGATRRVYEAIRLGGRFDAVCDHIAALAALKTDGRPKVMLNVVLLEDNFHQLDAFVDLASTLGVDQVNFKHCDVSRGRRGWGRGLFAARPDRALRRREKTLARARRRARKHRIATTAFGWLPDEQPVCAQDPRTSLFVRFDGVVAPCINLAYGGPSAFLGREVSLPPLHFGRLPDPSLADLWQEPECRRFRSRLEQREAAYERAFWASDLEPSPTKLKQVLDQCRRAMPAPPDGCRSCHYLYNL